MPTPLGHIRVLDVTRYIAGPYCTKLLADYGADVVKVEQPGVGDLSRRSGPFPRDVPHPEKSGLFLFLNTNKKGITLNLKTAAGQDLFRRLAADVDILVENFRPGVMASWGLGHDDLARLNPRLSTVSISNFGQTGPYRGFKSAEIIAQAMGGLMYVTGLNAREPLKVGLSQTQFWVGTLGAQAALSSVFGARAEGKGHHVDLSLIEAVASGLQGLFAMYSYTGMVKWRQARELAGGINGIVPCRDGYVIPTSGHDWATFANCLEAPELLAPQFATAEDRSRNVEDLTALLLKRFQSFGGHELYHRGQEWGMPFGVVQEPHDLVGCEHLKARDFWRDVDHPVAGRITFPGMPFKMSKTPGSIRAPAPLLGQHNDEVYQNRLGLRSDQLAALHEQGIV